MKPLVIGCVVLICLCLLGCGGSKGSVTGLPRADAPVAAPRTQAEALAQLDALPLPDGVDAATFAELKSALRAMLEQMPPARFTSTPPTGPANKIMDLTTGIDDDGNEGIQWNYLNVGDYDLNSEVNISDITPIGQHFHKNTNSPDWKSAARFADGDGNGEVNISDITPIGQNFLRRVATYRIEGGNDEASLQELDELPFEAGTPLLTGIRMYHYLPAVQYPVYRVTPLDEFGTPGESSMLSQAFIISDKTRIVGQPGGPAFNAIAGSDLTLDLPAGAPTPIEPGDIVVGSDQGGYLLKVLDVQRSGDQLEIAGEPAILTDVFLQGGLAEALDDISQVPPAAYTLDLSGQILHDDPALYASIIDGSLTFLPQADVAVNYNQYGGVTYLRGLVLGGPMDLDMTVSLYSSEWSGPFPPTPAETGFYEHKMTGFTFDFTAYQNDVPVTMALQYDVYVGIRGEGDFFGEYQGHIISSYDNIKMGGIFNSAGIEEFNEFTPTHGTVEVPIIGNVYNDFTFTAYVRAEIHTRLYGNPIPGNTEDLALNLIPQLTLSAAPTTTPSDGMDYLVQGSLDTSYMLALHHIGMGEQQQANFFTGPLDTVLFGFIPTIDPPG
jgi:hypothetical protein